MQPGEKVEVEASNAHDWVVGVFLVWDQELGGGVPDKGEVVVARANRLEEGGAGGEQGEVLDVRIVFLGP